MKRVIVALSAVALAASASGFAVYRFRPDLLPDRLRPTHAATAAARADDAESSTLESDASDDGWVGHLGTSAPKGVPRSLDTIKLTSAEVAARIGIATATAQTRPIAEAVSGNAEISFVSHDYAHVTSRVSGRVAEVPADEGESVKKGDVLVVVDSAEVGTAKAQYLSILPVVELARKDGARSTSLRRTIAVSEQQDLTIQANLAKAEAEFLNARQKLANLGFTDAEIARIEATKDTSNFLKIIAPLSGRLVERHAVIGEAVTPPSSLVTSGQMAALFEIADLREMWAWIDVGEADVTRVEIGQDVTFTISGTDRPVFSGKVELISFAVNAATRTVRVRAGLENVGERLRSNQYGRAVIRVGPERPAVVIPRSAVQSEEGVEFVFLPQADGLRFRTQRVATRPTERPDEVETRFGLHAGESVVTTGSFLLKTELFKSKLGGEG